MKEAQTQANRQNPTFAEIFSEDNPLFGPAQALRACGFDAHFTTRYVNATETDRDASWQEGLAIVDRHSSRAVITLWFANGAQQPYTGLDEKILAKMSGPALEAVSSLASGAAAVYEAGTPEGAVPSSYVLEQSQLTAVFQMPITPSEAAAWPTVLEFY